jgi:ATP-binding cassette, subfamily C (CFTR/MRP), member 1
MSYEYDRRERKLDQGVNRLHVRQRWYELWRSKDLPPDPPIRLQDAPVIPLATASWWSVLTFSWISSLMELGYQRTLQATDLYAMDESRSAGFLGTRLEEAWARRVEKGLCYVSVKPFYNTSQRTCTMNTWRVEKLVLAST